MRIAVFSVFSILCLILTGSGAMAFSAQPAPSGPGMQSQFSDPDAAIDRLADTAAGQTGTEATTGAQIPSGAHPVQLAHPSAAEAEPVNPGWPAWMVWHN
jgi:hypothetical protein